MTTKYYTSFEPCECCGLSKQSTLLGITSGLRKGYKFSYFDGRFPKYKALEKFIKDGEFDFIENQYEDILSREEMQTLIDKARKIVSLNFEPC